MKPLSRRTLLRGTGAALALPWLDAMLPPLRSAPPARNRARALVFLYVPNGIHMQDWTPSTEGSGFELPWILQPLAAQERSLLVLSGLEHDKARANGDGPGDHARAAAAFLTGRQPDKQRVRAGVSIDQVLAARAGLATRVPSLALGVEGGAQSGNCDSGYPCAYSSNLSWTSPTTPALKETDPRQVFDRLFRDPWTTGGEAIVARRRSVLDLAREDAKRLAQRLGGADRSRLDDYLEGVRSLEQRLDRAAKGEDGPPEDVERPERAPEGWLERAETMLDLLALALRADSTRVATLMLANEGSNRSYPNLEVAEGHHFLSHHGGDEAKQEQIRRINRFHVERLAGLLERLGRTDEGGESTLARTTVVYGSAISDGNRHNHDELPLLLAGAGCDGRHVRVPAGTPACDLFVTLARRFGVPLDSFGDSRGDLDEVLSA